MKNRVYNAEPHLRLSDTLRELAGIVSRYEKEGEVIQSVDIFIEDDGWHAIVCYEEL